MNQPSMGSSDPNATPDNGSTPAQLSEGGKSVQVKRRDGEWIFGQTGWQEMTQVGRGLSALADLGMVFLVYLVGRRLYGRRVGTLAIAFGAAVVLQIQQSHFFTMDSFAAFFSFLAFYFAVIIATTHP